ncbi:hypothetical protein AVEN_260232-1 [Araneus ventricosus]|uniref:Uncharacterized protein n=1 Tax=Araneus ventricosus TaxID=182803 RepID=A0A4Y2K0V2_ARAVE|nr:hypothetical protein AVEN_46975-1 [Araneus ventricosus]GBM96303.1 hypothetical protein AVEN_111127-1 [Araneus ventricosus]GBM96314.1 hypothetical protein AVEN_211932-1 [Araneus ventricosus]GBM97238.1 hypothetical protein AVEN_260232-1 [Araneus ventricosus]
MNLILFIILFLEFGFSRTLWYHRLSSEVEGFLICQERVNGQDIALWMGSPTSPQAQESLSDNWKRLRNEGNGPCPVTNRISSRVQKTGFSLTGFEHFMNRTSSITIIPKILPFFENSSCKCCLSSHRGLRAFITTTYKPTSHIDSSCSDDGE